jgi:YggT family protein
VSVIIYIIYLALVIYGWLIVARAVLSWFPSNPGSGVYPIRKAVFTVTDPYLNLFRRFLPVARVGNVGLDLSALVGLVVIFILVRVLAQF